MNRIQVGEKMPPELRKCLKYPDVSVDCKALVEKYTYQDKETKKWITPLSFGSIQNQAWGITKINDIGYKAIMELIVMADARLEVYLPPFIESRKLLKQLLKK